MKNINYKALAGILCLALTLGLSSCGQKTYKNIKYMQDLTADTTLTIKGNSSILVQPMDMISIVVSSQNPELSAMFNLANVSYQAGAETTSMGSNYRIMGYSVDNYGDIQFPVLGKINVAGLTRWEVADKVKRLLQESGQLSDPVVTVEFVNFKVSVMGEVERPGTFNINGDKITLFEALSLAGDLTIFGKRDNIQVIREKAGRREIYILDLRSSDVYNSPAYYLQQNDIVYVSPNKVRAGQSTVNENNFRSASFWVSISSAAITAANIIITLTLRAKK